MTLEQASYRDQPIPDWVQRERWADLAWIADNLPAFNSAASIAYEALGRGAVVVETTYLAQDGGHPAAYLTQDQIARYEDVEINRLIAGYAPEEELVVVLLKEAQRTSAYRVRNCLPGADLPPIRPAHRK
jgi:hypothetical protein